MDVAWGCEGNGFNPWFNGCCNLKKDFYAHFANGTT